MVTPAGCKPAARKALLVRIKSSPPKYYLKYDNKNYFADFYLPDFDLYLDPKNNYKAILDKDKIEKVIQQNKVKVLILLEDQLTQEYIASITQLV